MKHSHSYTRQLLENLYLCVREKNMDPADSRSVSLRTRFTALAKSLGATPRTVETWSAEFIARYSEPQRHYHTHLHVEAMLKCIENHRAEITDTLAVELAVYFHDWIYYPRASSNEADSIESCFGLRHVISDNVQEEEMEDLGLFLDFDLEVLSRDWETYLLYADQIRKEYACFGQNEYNMGRTKVLQDFLERKKLYFSHWFQREKEGAARRNVAKEIQLLGLPAT
jgi:predicted metal-dependent HD superfamily phosphohydrolase